MAGAAAMARVKQSENHALAHQKLQCVDSTVATLFVAPQTEPSSTSCKHLCVQPCHRLGTGINGNK